MITQSVGIRALAVRFPRTIRTNDYWLQKFPEMGMPMFPRQARLTRSAEIIAPQTGIDLWLQEVAAYQADPFRGSVERRVLAPDESPLMLECCAGLEALKAANLAPEQVDLAIVAGLFPEAAGSGLAALLAQELGLRCPAWNLASTCSSALIALQTAEAFVKTGVYRQILILVSHIGSRAVNEADTLSWSMGDAAGAFVVGGDHPDRGILSTHVMPTTATLGAYQYDLVVDAQGNPQMQMRTGENVSRLAETAADAVRYCCQAAVRAAGVNLDQIACFAFNTPTAWYASVCAKALGVDPDRVLDLYPLYANIGSVFPMANLYQAATTQKISENDLVLVYTNGAAATAVATVMRWGEVALGALSSEPTSLPEITETLDCTTSLQSVCQPAGVQETLCAPTVKAAGLRAALLAALPSDRAAILEPYVIEWLANLRQLDPAQIKPESVLTTLLDSLMAIVFRSQIATDLQVNVPMSQFFGEQRIKDLTDFLLQQLAIAEVTMPEAIDVTGASSTEREIVSL